jgi:two-component system, chemotaxis family, sensor kinase CheA
MDDFYAECEDHLRDIRRAVLQLENETSEAGKTSVLESLFRSFHSLKGILGMAGLPVPEGFAHQTEDYLRALSRNELAVSSEGIDALLAATGAIEELVAGHRDGKTAPDSGTLAVRLANLTRGPAMASTPGGRSTAEDRMLAAARRGIPLWKVLFSPATDRDTRGVNVSSVRAQLKQLGEIVQSSPKVQPGGKVQFEFIVAGEFDEAQIAALAPDGVEIEPFQAQLPQGHDDSATNQSPTAEPNVSAQSSLGTASHFVRVELSRLDDLMQMMSDLVLQRARLDDAVNTFSAKLGTSDARTLQEISGSFARDLRNLRNGLMRVRLVPVGEIFERLPFVVRDLAREYGKKIRLSLTGQGTEIDKYLVERLKDPLLHLVRNAISHGIEPPDERVAKGKTAEGQISLRASTEGELVIIEVKDDGRGVDPERVMAQARAQNLTVPENPSLTALLDIICIPGFSTRNEADRGAGRGVGMSAVKSALIQLGGELSLASEPGKGTTFTLRLPLTLAIADALIISAGGQRFAMPQALIQEITTTTASQIRRMERNELIVYRNGVLPLIRLGGLFGLPEESRHEQPVLVIGTGSNSVGIVTDRVIGQREIVVRTIDDPLLKVPAISGATELGDGRAVLILDANSLVQAALHGKKQRLPRMAEPASTRQESTKQQTQTSL